MAKGKVKPKSKEELDADTKVLNSMLDGAASKPDGLVSRRSDVAGFWPPEGAGGIWCTPLHMNLSDGAIEKIKPSVLVFARLEAPRKLFSRDGEVVQGVTGDIVAFWARPGMRPLRNCAGIKTWIAPTDETVDVGKGNAMKVFAVETEREAEGKPLLVQEDNRKESRQVKHFFQ